MGDPLPVPVPGESGDPGPPLPPMPLSIFRGETLVGAMILYLQAVSAGLIGNLSAGRAAGF